MTPFRLLFFTGGSALRGLSEELATQNIYSVHLVTTFDSGGSTGALRRAFAIPALGDIRNRLLALADRSIVPQIVIDFCNLRLPLDCPVQLAHNELLKIGNKRHKYWQMLPEVFRQPLWTNFKYFLLRMHPNFDPRGANIGNLILAGSYLEHKRDFGPGLVQLSRLLHTKGMVLPIVNASLHLGARLIDGQIIIGQHNFNKALPAPIEWLFLTVHESGGHFYNSELNQPISCRPQLFPDNVEYINSADAICYPMGSFYSSVVANLLPAGVGRAITGSPAPKIFIPNSGHDPEVGGMTIAEQARVILDRLHEDIPEASNSQLLNYVLVDSLHGVYPGGVSPDMVQSLDNMGIKIIDRSLVMENNPKRHVSEALSRALEEIACKAR